MMEIKVSQLLVENNAITSSNSTVNRLASYHTKLHSAFETNIELLIALTPHAYLTRQKR